MAEIWPARTSIKGSLAARGSSEVDASRSCSQQLFRREPIDSVPSDDGARLAGSSIGIGYKSVLRPMDCNLRLEVLLW